jgi:hypothetical protein
VVVAGAVILQQVLQAAHTSTCRLPFKQGWSIQTRHVSHEVCISMQLASRQGQSS